MCGSIWRHFVSRKVRFWAVVRTRLGGICRGAGIWDSRDPRAKCGRAGSSRNSRPDSHRTGFASFSLACLRPALVLKPQCFGDRTGGRDRNHWGPGFGFEHFKSHDFLREGEVVLTFDDGPWPKNTQAVLAALAAHCTKAIFFPIGLHATYEPAILKQVAAAGHVVGSHTWCHQDLSKTKGRCNVSGKVQTVEYNPKDEIEMGISAVSWAVGGPTAPYFRFPALRQPQELIDYLAKRNIAIFSADMDSFDFKMRKPEQVRQSVMEKLKKHGKGIVLMHDFQHATAEAAMDLLNDLKAGGYKIVFMQPKFAVTTIAAYDETILKQVKGSGGGDARPTSSVVRTISE